METRFYTPEGYPVAQDAPVPPPYESKTVNFSPYSRRCAEIDRAALLVKEPEAFAALAAEPEVSQRDPGVYWERPSKKFSEAGGCPCYQGLLNYGSGANVLCEAASRQFHDYVGVKFCEGGRKIYCPIWRAKNKSQIVSKSDTEEGPEIPRLLSFTGTPGEEKASQ